GDASMSPYEIAYAGGANEHWNAISGKDWLRRTREQWPNSVWLNPVPEKDWPYTQSIGMIQRIFDNRMAPMTLDGISSGMKLIT
ncbi:VWA domain-containing protein, partial [Planktomarina temperata]|nr:VWA domain-containing protein [Planktomarina temperata]